MGTPSVLVLGGGIAGLAAACDLADHQLGGQGLAVTLVEAAPHCGGAAATLVDPRTGFEIDLAPPVFAGGGQGFVAWLKRLGAGDRLLDPDVTPLELWLPGHVTRLTARSLPGSLRLAASVLGFDALETVDRGRALAGAMMLRLGRPRPAETHSFYRWLRNARQSTLAITRLWNPLCIAVCGLPVEEVVAEVALAALGPSLGDGASGIRLALARVSLDRLVNPLLPDALRARRVELLTGRAVRRIVIAGDRVSGVELEGGRLLRPDAVVSALPPAALLAVMPESRTGEGPFAMARAMRFASRPSVHLFYDRSLMGPPVAVTLGQEPLWLVNRRRSGPGADLRSGAGTSAGAVAGVSVYPAAGSQLGSLERDEAVARADEMVRAVIPDSRDARLVHALTVVQPGGVLLAGPGSTALRPGPVTGISNLWLAGSWTGTGLPGSPDGAVASGRRAAAAARTFLSTHVPGPRTGGPITASPGNIEDRRSVVDHSTVERRPSSTTLDRARWGGHTP